MSGSFYIKGCWCTEKLKVALLQCYLFFDFKSISMLRVGRQVLRERLLSPPFHGEGEPGSVRFASRFGEGHEPRPSYSLVFDLAIRHLSGF